MLDPVDRDREAVGNIEQHAEPDRRPADHDGAAQQIADMCEDETADNHDRDGRDNELRHHLQARIATYITGPVHAFEHHPDIAPQIRHHGAQGADMDGDIDHQALVLPAGNAGDQYEVTGRTDGQKFRQSLDQGDDGELDECHRPLRGKDG